MRALHSVIMDRQTHIIHVGSDTACMMPMGDYIQLLEMKRTLEAIIPRAMVGDILAIQDILEQYSSWVLEGGGNQYVRGDTDA